MTEQELGHVTAAVLALWPRYPWPDATVAVARPILRDLDYEAVKRAITALSKEGREYAPPPGLIWARADAIAREIQPRLPEPEVTADDWERSRGFAYRLRQAIADIARRREMNAGGRN